MINTHIIIIEDNIQNNDPLIFELEQKYGKEHIHLFTDSQEGLNYLMSNLKQRMVVLLDIKLPGKDGHIILDELRAKTELIPVIIWSALNGKIHDFTDFIKNHAFSFLSKGADTKEIISELEKAIRFTSTSIDVAIEQWLEKQDEKDNIMLATKSGKSYSANQLIEEIRKQTDEGKHLVNNINKLTLDLLFRGKEQI
jgi:DNA-binding NtrC family response regulator